MGNYLLRFFRRRSLHLLILLADFGFGKIHHDAHDALSREHGRVANEGHEEAFVPRNIIYDLVEALLLQLLSSLPRSVVRLFSAAVFIALALFSRVLSTIISWGSVARTSKVVVIKKVVIISISDLEYIFTD